MSAGNESSRGNAIPLNSTEIDGDDDDEKARVRLDVPFRKTVKHTYRVLCLGVQACGIQIPKFGKGFQIFFVESNAKGAS